MRNLTYKAIGRQTKDIEELKQIAQDLMIWGYTDTWEAVKGLTRIYGLIPAEKAFILDRLGTLLFNHCGIDRRA